MPRPKTKTKATSHSNVSSNNRPPPHEALPSSTIQTIIPPIATLTPAGSDLGEASELELMNLNFPLSCARDEPFVFVHIPSPPPSPPPKRSKKYRSERPEEPVVSNTKEPARPQDQEDMPQNSSSTSQVVAEKAKKKRVKIQVQKSFRVLRPRGCQPSILPEEALLDSSNCPSTLPRLIQGKENNETSYWEASWDKWATVRGTIRRKK